jgi:hypothetical protein
MLGQLFGGSRSGQLMTPVPQMFLSNTSDIVYYLKNAYVENVFH